MMKEQIMPGEKQRYRALDSLRGIAACTVVLGHFCNLAPLIFLRHTPMRLLLGGHEAVILFFVLSGFVLTMQISSRTSFNYTAYAAQRIARIYLPYFFAFLCGLVCYTLANTHPIPWAGHWFNSAWEKSLPVGTITGHMALIFPFHTWSLVPVFWTLVYEMRISLLLPICIYAAQRTQAIFTLLSAIALSSLSYIVVAKSESHIIFSSIKAEWAPTLHYTAIFMIGIVLALYRETAIAFVREKKQAFLLLGIGIAFFFAGSPIGFALQSLLGDIIYDWVVALGASCIILSVLSGERIAHHLRHPWLIFLGDISYSLYLLHALVLLTVVHLLGESLPHMASILIALSLTVPIAYLSYRCIEVPSIRLGHALAQRIRAFDYGMGNREAEPFVPVPDSGVMVPAEANERN